MTLNARAWQAGIRLANGQGRPGDQALAIAACTCNHCCARAYEQQSN